MLLERLSYRRAARMVEISKTEVGDSLDLLRGMSSGPPPLVCLGRWLHQVPDVEQHHGHPH